MPAAKTNHRSSAPELTQPRLTGSRDPVRSASSTTPGRFERGVGQPERSREDVGRTGRDDAEGRDLVVQPVGQQPVDDLVDRPVTAEGDHRVRAVAHRPAGQRGGVPAVGRFGELELGFAAQGVDEHVPFARGRRRRARVGDDEDAHRATKDNPSVELRT